MAGSAPNNNSEIFSVRLGLTGLYLFAAFSFIDNVNNDIALFLMLIALLMQYKKAWNTLRHDLVIYIFGFSVCYITFLANDAAQLLPNSANAQWHATEKWLKLWLFILVAWWLDGNTKRILWVLSLAFLSLIVQASMAFDWSNWDVILENKRLRLGLNINATTLISGIGLIALLIFLPRFFTYGKATANFKRAIYLTLWTLVFIFLLEIMLLTQSRSAWFAVGITLTLIAVFYSAKYYPLIGNKNTLILATIFMTVIAAVGYMHHEKVLSRISKESVIFIQLTNNFNIDNVPYSSLGSRIHLWHFGLKRWLEKPFFGWGPGTSVTTHIQRSDYGNSTENKEAQMLRRHPHVHNAYLAILIRFGVVGALIFVTFVALIYKYAWIEQKKGTMDKQVFYFFTAALLTWLIANMAMYRVSTQEDRALLLLLFGFAYSYHLATLKRQYA
jgi:O-antigen ligase